MLVELNPRLGSVVRQVLHRRGPHEQPPSLSSKRARERREAYEREDFKTYVGNVHLGLQDDWSFRESTPFCPPNPEPNVAYGNHVLRAGDYLTVYRNNGNERVVLWEGTLRFYSDGGGYRHLLGVDEPYLLGLFIAGCPAELRAPTLATAGETVFDNTVFGGAQVREPVFEA